MLESVFVKDFAEWRREARRLLQAGVEPLLVTWNGEGNASPLLDLGWQQSEWRAIEQDKFKVPKDFIHRAEVVACNNGADTWDLLYRLLWRIAIDGEKHLLSRRGDSDVADFTLKEKQVRWERHKMTAYVRFRKVDTGDGGERETFVAWYEPVHDVVKLAAPFFRDRFAAMDWSILTPRTCVHWNGKELRFSEGAKRLDAPGEDELEAYWKKYYASIFNPARLNLKLMEREMPRRYWQNLPEAELIGELAKNSYGRVEKMVDHAEEDATNRRSKRPRGAPDGREEVSCSSPEEIRLQAEGVDLSELASLSSRCRACDLCWQATQTVWGEGPEDASVVLVGEQPGDQEDLQGRPFVGPAGKLLDEALSVLGIWRQELYLTNAVKHFKWTPSGKRRLHQTPNARDVNACKPWLEAELRALKPTLVVCLGATAAKAILGAGAPSARGYHEDPGRAFDVLVTYHPAYLLRVSDEEKKRSLWEAFCQDLSLVKLRLDAA